MVKLLLKVNKNKFLPYLYFLDIISSKYKIAFKLKSLEIIKIRRQSLKKNDSN